MPESPSPSPNESDAPPLSCTGEPTPPTKSPAETLRDDYPDSLRQPTANPLSTDAHALTERGMALRRLGLNDHDVRDLPRITPRVKEAVGTVKAAVRILSGDDAPDSIAFMTKWRGASKKDKLNLHLEDIICAAGLTARRFMELLAGASMEHSITVSKLIMSKSQPKVLKATVKAATDSVPITAWNSETKQIEVVGATNGDVKAQEIFHKITGALPTPKGANFTLNQQINNPSGDAAPKERTPLQAMDAFLLEIEDVRKPKQLTARVEPIIPVEMPEGAPEIEYLGLED